MTYDKEFFLNPNLKVPNIDLNGYSNQELLNFYKKMFLIREAEKTLAKGKKNGQIGGPVHLGAGQEAIPTAISSFLNKSDKVFGNHRSHTHIISLGTDLRRFFAEILGRENGLCKGRGGSMHLIDQSVGFFGSVPIVAGSLSIAVGAALASKLRKDKTVVVAFFGDSVSEEGIFHESLNFAKLYSLPILFVAENNLFASHMYITERQSSSFTSRFADSHSIKNQVVDGNNVIDIHKCASKFIQSCRNGEGPCYLEAFTYRWYGHVDWREDIDVGLNRSEEDLILWKERDPLKRLKNEILSSKNISHKLFEKEELKILNNVDKAWNKALMDPYPDKLTLLENVYADRK